MKSVAQAVGVSVMTVSRVLRNRPEIKPETRRRVWAEVAAQGYKPNPLVSALMTQLKAKEKVRDGAMLALVHCLPEGYELSENMMTFREAARARAGDLGYGLIEFYLRDYGMIINRIVEILQSRGIRGIIFEHFFTHGHRFNCNFSSFACVALGNSIAHPEFHRIASDQFREMQIALHQAESRGYRRIGYATLREVEILCNYQRMAALALAQSYMERSQIVPRLEVESFESLEQELLAWYERHRPDVILTQHPASYKFLTDAGIRIPEDVGFLHLGYNAKFKHVGGVDPNWRQRGVSAVDRVVNQLNRNEFGVPESPTVTYVKSEWVEGPSLREAGLHSTGAEMREFETSLKAGVEMS